MIRLPLPGRRILAYLALHPGAVSRGRTAGQLWPDQPELHARANVRRALWQVPDGWIASFGEELMLQAEVDLPRVRLAAAKSLEGHELTLEEIVTLSEDVLPGWHEEWVTGTQDAFRLLRVQALEAACRSMTASGHHDLAAQAGLAALAAEPLRESAADALIGAHLMQGNRYEALRCYQDFAQHLRHELGVRPNPSLTERFDAMACSKQAGQNGAEDPLAQTTEIAATSVAGQQEIPADPRMHRR